MRVPSSLTSTFQSEPWISGNIVVWKDASSGSQVKGVWVHNLATGKRILVRGFDTESPHAVAGRYVVFPVSKPSDDRYEAIRLYDTATGTDIMLFTPNHGWGVGNWVGTGQHSVVFQNGKTGKRNRSLLTVVRLR
jgi:hypothetical protein